MTAVPLLELRHLGVTYPGATGPALHGVSLGLEPGEVLGLAGGSGSGKTTLAHAVLRLLPAGTVTGGRVLLQGEDVAAMSWGRLRAVRWAEASVVFQGARHSLNPVRTVGAHLADPIRLHEDVSRAAAAARAGALLEQVGLDRAHAGRYPHQLSGGQRQRVLLAMALACGPRLVVADEPTTALDPPARAHAVGLLRGLARHRGLGLLLISHDLRVLAGACDRVAVLREGRLVESGPVRRVLERPQHPGTAALVAAAGRFGDPRHRPAPAPPADPAGEPLLQVRGLVVHPPEHAGRRRRRDRSAGPVVPTVRGVDLDLHRGEVLALIGEVGAGKTTLARALVGLVPAAAGEVRHAGVPLDRRGARLHAVRRHAPYMPQEPMSALSPRHTVRRAVAEGPRLHGAGPAAAEATAVAVLAEVGLRPVERFLDRYPHQLSAGQQQRVVLAAALALRPRLLIADEPVASLDAVASGQVLDLLLRLRGQGLGVLLVTHDLAAAWQVADRVAVLRAGRLVESGPAERVLLQPGTEHARRLVRPDPGGIGGPPGTGPAPRRDGSVQAECG